MESKKQWLENQKLIVSGWTSLSHLQIPSTKGLSHPSPHALKKKKLPCSQVNIKK